MKKKILVLGSTGMLGSIVYRYFSNDSDYQAVGTARKDTLAKIKNKKKLSFLKNRDIQIFNFDDFLKNEKKGIFFKEFHYIINCIGIIKPYCQDDNPKGVFNAINVNSLFPHRLSGLLSNSKTKIIQIATDCVYSGSVGRYKEDFPHDPLDVYGKTKSLGEVASNNLLNLRCSVVGPDDFKKVNLLEWLFGHKDGSTISGYAHHKWNGITTLQFAQVCKKIIDTGAFDKLRKQSHVHHYVPNRAVNKYELLRVLTKVFHKDYLIEKVDSVGKPIDRTLLTNYSSLRPKSLKSMSKAAEELRDYLVANGLMKVSSHG